MAANLSPPKSKRKHKTTGPLVLTSLTSALPVALSDTTVQAMPPQVRKSDKMRLKDLLRPASPRSWKKSWFDDSPTSPDPHRWRSSPLKRRKKKNLHPSGAHSEGDSPKSDREADGEDVPAPRELETTQILSLPGQTGERERRSVGEIPTILVSPEDSEEHSLMRKTSQTSHLSTCSSSGDSPRLGSVLSPSGDEEGVSDQESLLSPLSVGSSIGGSREDLGEDEFSSSPANTDGETDYIDEDLPPSCPAHVQALTIPPPKHTSGSSSARAKKKKWDMLKKAVQWSPFVQVYRKKYPWVQLAGHQGNFSPGEENGTIIKKSSKDEAQALKKLMDDVLRPCVPEYRKETCSEGEVFIEMSDLLRDFDEPAVMDVKMGTRTYLENELVKARTKKVLRKDMYEKMIAVDRNEPTAEEHEQMAITKPRYMQWRETLSSTARLGFRIEGIKMASERPMKDEFKTLRESEDILKMFRRFTGRNPILKEKFLQRLKFVRTLLEKSVFFQHHEVIGSSLLFVYDSTNSVSVHMIDFGKTVPLEACTISHRATWEEGNHEDGYLLGLDNLISLWETI